MAEEAIKNFPVVKMISLGMDCPPSLGKVPHHIRFNFDDIEKERNLAGYFGCTEQNIEDLISWCRATAEIEGLTVVHCAAGISRSSAALLGLLRVLSGEGSEAECLETLQKIATSSLDRGYRTHDFIRPNRRIVDILDRKLGLNGVLFDEVAKGPISFIYRNSPYDRI